MRRDIFIALITIGLLRAVAAASPEPPTKTQVLDSFSQLGVDTPAPRFGWVVNDCGRGEVQTAYEIIVSASQADIDQDKGALWDSGKVVSARQYGITYGGAALTNTNKYWWKVRTWNKEDQSSTWSEASYFVTGFFAESDWDAATRWIRHPQATACETGPPPMFRKAFQISKPIRQAYLYLSGLGQFVAFLNGTRVGDHETDPAWTDYDKTVDYVTFDVTAQLHQGANALGVMLGPGWFGNAAVSKQRGFGPLKLWGQLHIDFSDGSCAEVVTDPGWKVAGSPFTSIEVHGAENYDARLEQAGWDNADFDASNWLDAVEAARPLGALASQNAPPVVARRTLTAVNITNPAPDVYLYDFGQNINGIYEITVHGPPGAQVKIMSGETVSNSRVQTRNTAGSTYTLKGDGVETWRLTFSSIGFRYVEVRNVSRDAAQTTLPCLQDVKAYFTYTASRDVGSFWASDSRYNQIHDLALATIRSDTVSIHQDGPTFEKLGWQEVAWTMLPSAMFEHDLLNLYTKIAGDLRDAQRTVGMVPSIAPNWFHRTSTPPEGAFDDAPAWGASMFVVPWLIYSNYGDRKVLDDNYVGMKTYLAYLKTKERKELISYGLGDWMAPAGSTVPNVEGAVYVLDTRLMRDAAEALGRSDDARKYGTEYERVRNAYNAAFFDVKAKQYRPMSQANQAIPLAFGIVPEGDATKVAQALVEDIANPREDGTPQSYGKPGEFGPILPDHVTSGDIGTTFLWRALGEAGEHDLVQKMIMQTTAPSYMNMIANGETTMNENWNLAKARSHNHDMYAGILEWLYRTLGGISALEPGYAKIQLKPGLPTGLRSVTVSHDSMRGRICSTWNTDAGLTTWKIQVPVNASARVYVPIKGASPSRIVIQESGTTIFADGQPAERVDGMAFDHVEGTAPFTDSVVWEVGSGTYELAWRIIPGK